MGQREGELKEREKCWGGWGGSPLDKLQIDDTFWDQERSGHRLHGHSLWIGLNLELKQNPGNGEVKFQLCDAAPDAAALAHSEGDRGVRVVSLVSV